ncbi:hypothetical protein MA16_Dca024437 [Dendrobium catenatum]|uniref:Uncharacterized protein n=1 Tax=Dendrobium catenatum TaxID=906689 RepID=A0A2I0W512_9ASPA|nr:hypothetical protein MA16_Dca024437 [Dendrobium catenatum]
MNEQPDTILPQGFSDQPSFASTASAYLPPVFLKKVGSDSSEPAKIACYSSSAIKKSSFCLRRRRLLQYLQPGLPRATLARSASKGTSSLISRAKPTPPSSPSFL